MFSLFKKNVIPPKSIDIPSIGILQYELHSPVWFGRVNTIGPNEVELSIEPWEGSEPAEEQIKLIQRLPADYDEYMEILYNYIAESYQGLSIESVREMYRLAAIEMKKYNNEWYFTLEPNFNTPSIYDHFQRFTVVNNEIVWSNIRTYS